MADLLVFRFPTSQLLDISMECIDKVLSVAKVIYSLCNEVKMNHKRCQRLTVRIKYLLEPVKAIEGEDLTVAKVLKEMVGILERAKDFVESFTNKHRFSKVFKAYEIKEDFSHLNERLSDAAIALDLALQTEQTKVLLSMFKGKQRKKDDEQDTEEDQIHLDKVAKKLEEALHSMEERIQQAVETVNDGMEEMKMDLKDIKRIIESYNEKPSVHPVQDILELKREDIEVQNKPFMETANSKYYRGMLHKFPVAIKRFLNIGFSNLEEIRKIFRKEAATMKHFESPNIVRVYGICIDQKGSNPEFLIVMEYCELGSLRRVLEGEQQLSWQTRIRMALDATCGLYRMHQSNEKFKLLCSIDSARFLVGHGLRVKLGGLDLAKTETSIRRIGDTIQRSQMIPYISPQQLGDINYPYDKACEVYSFGIVLWEIASRKAPFRDCSDEVIRQKVCDGVQEALPSDCPKDLCELIDECRAYDPFERPKAGAIVDRLKNILNRISTITNESWD
ncbi:mixed lineage kinase domain-like protein isoform X1 [Carcharodon carcharias]|uniref:mixed lineage kinase domain-like protein isoform X1 n=2 Tax=Carcharodon carcharias TaxID=13397 RepID=UPI001B7F27CA|nr:mixed lineage kinase domain-like protein isoform X1 [Carcharodon carcharias]